MQLESIKLPPKGATIIVFLCSTCRCPKHPGWLINTAVEAKWLRPHTLWLCTSIRSPWLTESPLKRSNSSSPSQASWGNSSHITRRQTETGRAPRYAPAAPPAAIRTVRAPHTPHASARAAAAGGSGSEGWVLLGTSASRFHRFRVAPTGPPGFYVM